jgi:hypothetical protein
MIDAVESAGGRIDFGLRARGSRHAAGGTGRLGAAGLVGADRVFHVALFALQRIGIALELGFFLGQIAQGGFEHRQLRFDVQLARHGRTGEVFALLAQGLLDMGRELGMPAVEVGMLLLRQVAVGSSAAQFLAHLVGHFFKLAHGLLHHGLGRGIFDLVEQRVSAARDHTTHTGSQVVSHENFLLLRG